MNAEECAIVQKLVSNLDDSCLFYRILKRHLCSAHARFLVSRMIDLTSTTADDLTRQMLLTGGLATNRGGGTLARLHALAASWMAMASVDREAACLKSLAHHGDWVMQRFQEGIARVEDLPPRLHHQLLVLESVAGEIEAWSPMDNVYPRD